jgi:2-haloacid dehalogenase
LAGKLVPAKNTSPAGEESGMSIRAVLFDVFGTLLDVHSVAARADQLFRGQGQRLAQLWREKQIEYTHLRTLSSRYVPFTQVTEDALQYACEALALPLDAAARGLLMHEYTQLSAYPDAVPALKRLQETGMTIGVLTNGDPGLIEDVLHSAQIAEYLDVLLSADQVHAYKTAPSVYELGTLTLKHPAHELLMVSSNGWDAIGAKWYGYVSFWVNRTGTPLDRLGARPDGSGRTLDDAVNFLMQQRKH